MNNTSLKDIVNHFVIDGWVGDITPLGEGMINNTYKVSLENNPREYVLQKINHHVFRNIDLLQNNMEEITTHIREKLIQAGEEDVERKTLRLVRTTVNALYYFDGESYWRMTILIPHSVTLQAITPENAYSAGKAFGHFQNMLSDLASRLGETIPNFHNMEFRLEQLREAVSLNKAGRLGEVVGILQEIEKRIDEMCICEHLHREGKLPKRINHCDTKVNNILFDEQGEVLCVIDLDTAMPGFVVSDYGDFMRSAGNTGKEDDKDLDNVSFNMEIFKAYTKGYLEEAKHFLTKPELELLPFGAKLITYMQLVRFLTDYLNGDEYYKVNSPTHNLERSRAQLKLLQDIELKYDAMKDYILSLL